MPHGEPTEDPSAQVDAAAPDPAVPATVETRPAPTYHRRLSAAGEVVLCSGFPTQLTLVVLLGLLGAGPTDGAGELSLTYVVTLSLIDAAMILSLVWLLMRAHGEHPLATMLGRRPIGSEVLLGLALVPAALLIVAAAFTVMSRIAPELRNVPENPLEALISSPAAAMTFAAVTVVAGGLREEVQQGRDAAVITGLLGALWGLLYLARGSMVAPFACHAGFNATEVLIAYVGGGG